MVEEKLANKEKIEISQDLQDEVDDARTKWMQVNCVLCASGV